MNKSYSTIANYYDNFTHNDCDYESWSQYLFDVAKKHNVKKVVDLACGTGKMTVLLAKGGLQTVGVDSCPQMLSVAQQKCRGVFVQQDMQKLSLPSKADMAVCVNDGTNYVSPQNLQAFFCQVAQNLKSGAPFVFDLSSEHKLTQVLADNVFYVDTEQATLLWTNQQKNNAVQMNLTLFERDGNKYLRSDESHLQYVHSQAFVEQCLQNAGFCLCQVSADYGKPLQKDSLRITFYATKN